MRSVLPTLLKWELVACPGLLSPPVPPLPTPPSSSPPLPPMASSRRLWKPRCAAPIRNASNISFRAGTKCEVLFFEFKFVYEFKFSSLRVSRRDASAKCTYSENTGHFTASKVFSKKRSLSVPVLTISSLTTHLSRQPEISQPPVHAHAYIYSSYVTTCTVAVALDIGSL